MINSFNILLLGKKLIDLNTIENLLNESYLNYNIKKIITNKNNINIKNLDYFLFDVLIIDFDIIISESYKNNNYITNIPYKIAFSNKIEDARRVFKYNVFDFFDINLLTKKDITYSLLRIQYNIEIKKATNSLEEINNLILYKTKIKFKTSTGFMLWEPRSIIYIMSKKEDSIIFLNNNENILVKENIYKIQEKLPKHFFLKLNKHIIINVLYINKINKNKNSLEIKINDDVEIISIN